MKKIAFLAAAILISGAMITGCGNSTSKEVKEAEATAEAVNESEGAPIELGPNDILEFGGAQPMPVVVDFSATWCPPCKQFKPIFHKLAKKYKGKVNFIYVDIDKAPQLAEQYGVTSVPTILFVDKEGVINRNIGFM
ncbi:co-chaperone YbbN, partial [uncultured Muribaculum sp.]